MCDNCDAVIGEHKRQMYRLRVCLLLERATVPTANLSIRALQYIADSYIAKMAVQDCAMFLQSFIPLWENENAPIR